MEIYWLFLIPSILLVLFSDKIDKAAKANQKLKKWLICISIVLAAISIFLVFKPLSSVF